jgi:hypothetical protein
MTDAALGIDGSKNTFDTNLEAGAKARSKSFANSPDGWRHPGDVGLSLASVEKLT